MPKIYSNSNLSYFSFISLSHDVQLNSINEKKNIGHVSIRPKLYHIEITLLSFSFSDSRRFGKEEEKNIATRILNFSHVFLKIRYGTGNCSVAMEFWQTDNGVARCF